MWRRRQRLTEGVSEAWCWCDCHSDNRQSHTFLVLRERDWLVSALGFYLHKALRLADACVGAWKVFNFCHEQRQWSDAMDPQFSSATLDDAPFKVNERCWCWRALGAILVYSCIETMAIRLLQLTQGGSEVKHQSINNCNNYVAQTGIWEWLDLRKGKWFNEIKK